MRTHTLLAVPLLLAVGCSGPGFDFVPVSGRVTKNGQPLANVRVTFQPEGENPGPGSAGTTDADGRYTLVVSSQQYQGDGAGALVARTQGPPTEIGGLLRSKLPRLSYCPRQARPGHSS